MKRLCEHVEFNKKRVGIEAAAAAVISKIPSGTFSLVKNLIGFWSEQEWLRQHNFLLFIFVVHTFQ